MLLSTSLSFSSSQLVKDIHTPAEGIVVPLVAVQLVESLEFRIRNYKIRYKNVNKSVQIVQSINWLSLLTLEVALNPRRCDTLR